MKGYNKQILNYELSNVDWHILEDSVQGYWNQLENKLIKVVDRVAPMLEATQYRSKNTPIPLGVKRKINKKKNCSTNSKQTSPPGLSRK